MGERLNAVVAPAELPESLRTFMAAPAKPEGAIQKVSYTHDGMIDKIVSNPWISQGDLAKHFGYTEGWVSQVIASDAFQARLAQRKNELIDPALRATIEERFKGIIVQSLEKLKQKMEDPASKIPYDALIRTAEMGAKALGYGAKVAAPQQNVQFVVNIPQKSTSSEEWARLHNLSAPRPALEVTSVEALPPAAGASAQEAHKESAETALGASGPSGRTAEQLLKELGVG